MIKYGLKLWSSNEHLFKEAFCLFRQGNFDFVELYHNGQTELDFEKLKLLKGVPVAIHNTNNCGFHEFEIEKEQLEIWENTKRLADFFESAHIVVHPGTAKNLEEFKRNLAKINDKRILIENMAGLDIYGKKTFGYNLNELREIQKEKEICFDLEKAVKSACYQRIDYKKFISDCLEKLEPFYFHISGGDKNTTRDEHRNLQEANFDLKWIKGKLEIIAKEKDVFFVFEVPKNENDLINDVENSEYFRKK